MNAQVDKKKICIFGGGICGLTIAHECIKKGYDVTIYEADNNFGGKALCKANNYINNKNSIKINTQTQESDNVKKSSEPVIGNNEIDTLEHIYPKEHSLRVYLQCYDSLFDTLKEIPFASNTKDGITEKTVFDNLVGTKKVTVKYNNVNYHFKPIVSFFDIDNIFKIFTLISLFIALKVKFIDVLFLIYTSIVWYFSSEKSKLEYGKLNIVEYLELDKRSEGLRLFVLNSIRGIVAAKPSCSSYCGMTVLINTFAPFLLSNKHRLTYSHNILSGPTNSLFIDPWVNYLKSLGCKIKLNMKAETIIDSNNKDYVIKVYDLINNETIQLNKNDYDIYVFAVPYNTAKILFPDFEKCVQSPTLSQIEKSTDITKSKQTSELTLCKEIENYTQEFSQGFQLYCKDHLKAFTNKSGFTEYLNSEWSIVAQYITKRTWNEKYIHGNKAVISVTLSSMNNKGGKINKVLYDCNIKEVFDEICYQLGIENEIDKITNFGVGYGMEFISESEYKTNPKYTQWIKLNTNKLENNKTNGKIWVTNAALYVVSNKNINTKYDMETKYKNIFLCGEFSDSKIKIPTMEKACQVGKICAGKIFAQV